MPEPASSRLRRPAARGRVGPGLLIAFGGVVLSAAACSRIPADISSTPEDPLPRASIHQLMVSVIDPAADILWSAVATVVTQDGVDARQPRSEEDWDRVRRAATDLVEASHVLSTTAEHVAREDPETWRRLVANFSRVSATMLDAVERRDVDRLFDEGGPLDLTCAMCHRRYWDSQDDAQRRIPSMQR